MNKKRYRKWLIFLLIINISGIFYLGKRELSKNIPNQIKMFVGEKGSFHFPIPFQAELEEDSIGVVQVGQNALTKEQLHLNFNEPFMLSANEVGEYQLKLKLFGLFEYKKINLDVIEKTKVYPCGLPIGIYIKTDGILVLGTGAITAADGLSYEPTLNLLKSGDYIVAVNEEKLQNKTQLIEKIEQCNGNDLVLSVRRNGEIIQIKVTPMLCATGEYKAGIWIRDDTQGIGTMTFIDQKGNFGALGHGITDVDTSILMEIGSGSIYKTEIMHIIKGESGSPGELVGMISYNKEEELGDIIKNTNQGIFGTLNSAIDVFQSLENPIEEEALELGFKQDIEIGPAVIRCKIGSTLEEYTIEIEDLELNQENKSRGIILRITDERLLQLTNGIVQGMSGSPIIQNGKVIGAVTHVFIQDSAKGYGTFIENMIQNIT